MSAGTISVVSKSTDGLFASQFKAYFSKVPVLAKHWKGVKAIDKIPRNLPVRHFLIVNLSPSSHPGTHWIVLFRSHSRSLELFNSLGFSTTNEIKPYLKFDFNTELSYNHTPVQTSTSSSCGLYCIYFAIHRLLDLDLPFEEFLEEIFSTNKMENESKVARFCHHLIQLTNEDNLLDF
jgi:hypothetical protein